MIEHHLTQLFAEMGLGSPPSLDRDGKVELRLGGFTVRLTQEAPVVHLEASVAKLAMEDRESFLLKMMEANFLGQGTGGGVLGLKEDESFLTLSLDLPYEVDYAAFKEAIEEFINYLEYWKVEATE